MKTHIKLLLSILGISMIAFMFRYCMHETNQIRLVPLGKYDKPKSPTSPPSHARAQRAYSLTAFVSGFKTPIELYGKVEDQHGDPVAEATVTLSPVDTPFGDESKSTTTLVSDAKGLFSIKGLHGFSMGVSAKKEGYLDIFKTGGPSSFFMLQYADDSIEGKRHSKPETPLVLKLYKIGPMEPLVYVESQRWRLPVDGTPKNIALDNKKGIGPHQIEFRFKTGWVNVPADNEHFGTRFDWSFEAKIPGGGFIWCDNEYETEAPEAGYKEIIRLEFKADMPVEQWQRLTLGSFFVKFQDGSYGRIRLEVDGMKRDRDSPIALESWLNTKLGSRNLATNKITASAASNERYKMQWK